MTKIQSFKLDFLVIGSRKAATTWLWELFKNQPEICVSEKVKESNFFSKYFERGVGWYESLFAKNLENYLYGEVDTSLLYHDKASENVSSIYPDCKVICVLRNPYTYLVSSYFHGYRKGDISASLEHHWDCSEEFRQEVMYATLYAPYAMNFPPENRHFIFYEDIESNPTVILQKLADFLCLRLPFDPSLADKVVNPGRKSKNRIVTRVLSLSARLFRKLDLHLIVNRVRKMGCFQKLYELQTSEEKQVMSSGMKRKVYKEIEKEMKTLSTLIDVDLNRKWKLNEL